MSRRVWFIAALLLIPAAAACGGDGDGGSAAPEAGAVEGVAASGNGWTATFPGEVEVQSDPFPLPGGEGTTSADSTTWETGTEALTIVTSDFPPEMMDLVDTGALLESTVTGNAGTELIDSDVLDADGSFRGRQAVAYEQRQDGLQTTGVAFVDGARLYQVLHITRGDDTSTWGALVRSFEFTS